MTAYSRVSRTGFVVPAIRALAPLFDESADAALIVNVKKPEQGPQGFIVLHNDRTKRVADDLSREFGCLHCNYSNLKLHLAHPPIRHLVEGRIFDVKSITKDHPRFYVAGMMHLASFGLDQSA